MWKPSPVVFGLFAVSLAGCGGAQSAAPPMPKVAKAPDAAPNAAPAAGGDETKPAADLPADRKIIFTGRLEVEVKDFAVARAELAAMVQQAKGYFAKTEIAAGSGGRRHGTFTIKVPVERFQPLTDAAAALGNPVKNSTDSQDVTDEYIDVAARVKNLKAEEEVFNRLLKESAGRLDDVFKIREQIRNVRGDIEKAEARLEHLGKAAALSTLTVLLRETSDYTAPTADAAKPTEPAFGERASGTFAESVGALKDVGQAVALVAIAVAPWLPVLAAGGVAGWVGWRRVRRRGACF